MCFLTFPPKKNIMSKLPIPYFYPMHPTITSTQNAKVKQASALEKARERKKTGRFLVEGLRELGYALQSGYVIERVFFEETQVDADQLIQLGVEERALLPVTPEVFAKLAYREKTAGVVAVCHSRPHTLDDLSLPKNPLVLVVEGVEKPGNLGALLRTADAANLDAVIVCDPLADFYNPNVIRSSVGTVFTRQLAAASSEVAIDWLKRKGVGIFATHLQAAQPYTETDFSGPSAIVVGTEATGLSDLWAEQSTANIIIPMRGAIDSMNVSAAAAVVIFEAVRQRLG